MIYILLSLIILAVQGFLGMADWWVLCGNWLIAGLICLGLTAVLNNQRLIAFNQIMVSVKVWVLLAGLMNLSAIYVASSISIGQLYLIAIGFTALFMTSFFCWQNKQMPVRSLSMGAIVGVLTLLYMPTILWIVVPLLVLVYLSSWSKDNLACIFTGFVTLVWVNYCLLSLCGSDSLANDYLVSFYAAWNSMTYSLPTLVGDGYTGLVFLGVVLLLLIYYVLVGLLSSSLNSLRMRSNVSLMVIVGILILLGLPSCWQLYLVLAGITICIDLLLSIGNEPSKLMIKSANAAIYVVLFLGIGEYLIRLAVDYISTISFSLPFEIPFLN